MDRLGQKDCNMCVDDGKASIVRLIAKGTFGPIRLGMSIDDALSLIGAPDHTRRDVVMMLFFGCVQINSGVDERTIEDIGVHFNSAAFPNFAKCTELDEHSIGMRNMSAIQCQAHLERHGIRVSAGHEGTGNWGFVAGENSLVVYGIQDGKPTSIECVVTNVRQIYAEDPTD